MDWHTQVAFNQSTNVYFNLNDKQVEDEFLKASEISLVSVQLREFASWMYVELNKNAINYWDTVSIKAWIYMLIFC